MNPPYRRSVTVFTYDLGPIAADRVKFMNDIEVAQVAWNLIHGFDPDGPDSLLVHFAIKGIVEELNNRHKDDGQSFAYNP